MFLTIGEFYRMCGKFPSPAVGENHFCRRESTICYQRNPFRVRKTPKKWKSLFKYGRTVINPVPTHNFHNTLFGVKNLSAGECPVHIVLSTSVDCGKIVVDNF